MNTAMPAVVTIEAPEARLDREIKEHLAKAGDHLLEAKTKLDVMQNTAGYIKLGYKSWSDYVATSLGLALSTFYRKLQTATVNRLMSECDLPILSQNAAAVIKDMPEDEQVKVIEIARAAQDEVERQGGKLSLSKPVIEAAAEVFSELALSGFVSVGPDADQFKPIEMIPIAMLEKIAAYKKTIGAHLLEERAATATGTLHSAGFGGILIDASPDQIAKLTAYKGAKIVLLVYVPKGGKNDAI